VEFEVEGLAPSVVVVRVRGAVAAEEVASWNEALLSAVDQHTRFVLVDATELRELCPEGLLALVEFCRDLNCDGGEVWLVGLPATVWLSLHAAGLVHLFTLRESLRDALRS
jgi:anti-anti-sigma factor